MTNSKKNKKAYKSNQLPEMPTLGMLVFAGAWFLFESKIYFMFVQDQEHGADAEADDVFKT